MSTTTTTKSSSVNKASSRQRNRLTTSASAAVNATSASGSNQQQPPRFQDASSYMSSLAAVEGGSSDSIMSLAPPIAQPQQRAAMSASFSSLPLSPHQQSSGSAIAATGNGRVRVAGSGSMTVMRSAPMFDDDNNVTTTLMARKRPSPIRNDDTALANGNGDNDEASGSARTPSPGSSTGFGRGGAMSSPGSSSSIMSTSTSALPTPNISASTSATPSPTTPTSPHPPSLLLASTTALAHTFDRVSLHDSSASQSGTAMAAAAHRHLPHRVAAGNNLPIDAMLASGSTPMPYHPMANAIGSGTMTTVPQMPSSSMSLPAHLMPPYDSAQFTQLVSLVAAATAVVMASTSASNSVNVTPTPASRCNSQVVLGSGTSPTDGGGNFAGYGVSVDRGVKTFSDFPGAELYLYHGNDMGSQSVFCQRTRYISDWSDMLGMTQVRQRLEDMILPGLSANAHSSGGGGGGGGDDDGSSNNNNNNDNDNRPLVTASNNTLFISGLPQSGIATAMHLFCRQNAVNLLDFHLSSPLAENYDWRLITLLKQHQPCVLLMHRFDTRWEDSYRFDRMARLRDRWSSVERQSFLQCWLVWAINTHADVARVMPLYQTAATPPHMPVSVNLADTFETPEQLAYFARMLLRKRGLLPGTGEADTCSENDRVMSTTSANAVAAGTFERQQAIAYLENNICQNVHILCTPGRLTCLIDMAIALATNSASSRQHSGDLAAVGSPAAVMIMAGGSARPPLHLTVHSLKTAYETVSHTSQRLLTGLPQ